MTGGSEVEIRPITLADRDALAAFSCRAWGQPWTAEVESTIHCLADELALTDAIVARGLWDGARLVAVVAWRVVRGGSWCESLALAVQTGYQRRGYARRLKELELAAARQAGCTVVISKVHRHNTAMRRLNESLGGDVERISDSADYDRHIIPV